MKNLKSCFAFIAIIMLCFSVACSKDRDPLTITFSPTNPTTQTDIVFESSQTGSGWKYTWAFGDGDGNTTNTSTVHHTYTLPGNYNVSLYVEHNGNPLGNCTVPIIVQ
ncbi:MAG: PKD domain-containing protein [Bacteroidota bacterium]|nr:PKD domain-containing protein [Bacteroidota bacterium]